MAKDGPELDKKGMVFAGSTSGSFDRRVTRRHVVNMQDGTYKM